MFPIDLIRMAAGKVIHVWLKSGHEAEGKLHVMDSYMNLKLIPAVFTYKDGTVQKMKELYVKGIEIMSMKIPNEAMEQALYVQKQRMEQRQRVQPQRQSAGPRQPLVRNFRQRRQQNDVDTRTRDHDSDEATSKDSENAKPNNVVELEEEEW